MDEKYINQYYKFLIENEERLKTDEKLVRETLTSHFLHVPKKLYKYRKCNRQNFKTLKEKQIYMPCADEFMDPFDYALNFDLGTQINAIYDFLRENINKIVFFALNEVLKRNKIYAPSFTLELVNNVSNKCFLADGTFLEPEFEKLVKEKMSVTDKKIMEKVKDGLVHYISNNEEEIYKLAKSVLEDSNNLKNRTREKSLVYCMTEDKSCMPMWENYADGYKGFCIEYDFSKWQDKPFEEVKNLIYLLPAIYLDDKPIFDIKTFIQEAAKGFIFLEPVAKNIPLLVELNKQLLYKDVKYSYEQEWRFAIKNEGNNLQSFPFVSAIYMGKDITENNIKHLTVIARKLKVPLYKQKIDFFRSEVQYENIEL